MTSGEEERSHPPSSVTNAADAISIDDDDANADNLDDEVADDDDSDSISALFGHVINLTIDSVGKDEIDASSTHSEKCNKPQKERNIKRHHHSRKSKQHPNSREHLRQRVSHLMSLFEEHGWFIPLPDPSSSSSHTTSIEGKSDNSSKQGRGKVWSNRNYGADIKRQRKQSERQILEGRIAQLESILRDEHGVVDVLRGHSREVLVQLSLAKSNCMQCYTSEILIPNTNHYL